MYAIRYKFRGTFIRDKNAHSSIGHEHIFNKTWLIAAFEIIYARAGIPYTLEFHVQLLNIYADSASCNRFLRPLDNHEEPPSYCN